MRTRFQFPLGPVVVREYEHTHTLRDRHREACSYMEIMIWTHRTTDTDYIYPHAKFFLVAKLLRGGGGGRKPSAGGHTCVSVYACKCLHYDSAK